MLARIDARFDDRVSHLIDPLGAHPQLPGHVAGRTGSSDLDVRDHRKSQLHLPLGSHRHLGDPGARPIDQKARKRAAAVFSQLGISPSRSSAKSTIVFTASMDGSRYAAGTSDSALLRASARLFMDVPLVRDHPFATELPPLPVCL